MDIASLEIQLRMALSRLEAAQSGLFPSAAPLIERYREDVVRLEREISALRR